MTTDQCLQLDIRKWRRLGLLANAAIPKSLTMRHGEVVFGVGIKAHADHVVVSISRYHILKRIQFEEHVIPLRWTSCYYGASRPWFICPIFGCGRRAAVLYLRDGLMCRCCAKLTYASQRELPHDRAYRRVGKVHARLGWISMQASSVSRKPRGMHQRTFACLMEDFYLRRQIWLKKAHSWLVDEPHTRRDRIDL